MNWSDERYVRLYTRDTVEWEMLPWQSRALWPLLLRKLDRASVLSLGRHGARGLAALVKLPPEVVEPGLAGLLSDGCICYGADGSTIVAPNFIEAQEAAQSDKFRARESRERKRSEAQRGESITKRDDASRNVTDESRNVTDRHAPSHGVTPRHTASQSVTPYRTTPCRAEPSVPDNADIYNAGARDPCATASASASATSTDTTPARTSRAVLVAEVRAAVGTAARAGVVPEAGLIVAIAEIAEVAGPNAAPPLTPSEYAVRFCDAFDAYRETCDRKPDWAAHAIAKHAARIQRFVSGEEPMPRRLSEAARDVSRGRAYVDPNKKRKAGEQ